MSPKPSQERSIGCEDAMQIRCGRFWRRSRKPLKTGWLIAACVMAVYIGAIQPRENARGISAERATGLSASDEWRPQSFWPETSFANHIKGVVGGIPGGYATDEKAPLQASVTGRSGGSARTRPMRSVPKIAIPDDRKMIRTSAMDLIVKNPRD